MRQGNRVVPSRDVNTPSEVSTGHAWLLRSAGAYRTMTVEETTVTLALVPSGSSSRSMSWRIFSGDFNTSAGTPVTLAMGSPTGWSRDSNAISADSSFISFMMDLLLRHPTPSDAKHVTSRRTSSRAVSHRCQAHPQADRCSDTLAWVH